MRSCVGAESAKTGSQVGTRRNPTIPGVVSNHPPYIPEPNRFEMNSKQSTPARWIECGTMWLAGAALLSTSAWANGGDAELPAETATPVSTLTLPKSIDGLREALMGGTFWGSLRYRYENVDNGFFADDAHSSTLRTRLGYKTGDFHGFTGVLEFSDVSKINDTNSDYDEGAGNVNRPFIPDPIATVVNQVYVNYGAEVGDIRIGRQRITLDNHRFIGDIAWRQTDQTFDAISFRKDFDVGFSVFYAFLDNVNTIRATNANMSSHLGHVSHTFDNVGTLTAYGYYLDYDVANQLSTFTYGGSFVGEHDSGDFGLLYRVELANQVDVEDNPNSVDAVYSHVNFGGKVSDIHVKVGYESLEGSSSGDPNRAFQTPLSTAHAFNGWADLFVAQTPAAGLEDTYLDLGYSNNDWAAGLILHQFETERSSATDYGDEVDFYATVNLAEDLTFGAKFAEFDAEDNTSAFRDTQRFWLWLALEF